MLDKPTNPLDIARTVLKPETISEIKMWGFTNSAYLILDRWALNCPDELKELEKAAKDAEATPAPTEEPAETEAPEEDATEEPAETAKSDD